MTKHRVCSLVCLAVAMLAAPGAASAQAVGFGPRISQVRGDASGSTDPTRLFGGTLRIMSSKHIALEGRHFGAGAEAFVMRKAAIFVDYRWRFVRFGEPEDDEKPIDIPALDDLKLSHRGSIWSGGVAFYF